MINIALLIVSFFFMEFVAWSSHKYVMHGFLWKWHKDHHTKDGNKYMPEQTESRRFEKNDLFFIIYALPAMILILVGLSNNLLPLVFIGIGFTIYGFTYFLIHDIIIHKRLIIKFLQKKPNFLIQSILRAHSAHHRPKNKGDFQNYGLLIFPKRYFKP